MKRKRKPWLSNAERRQIFDRWRKGESMSAIARSMQRDVGSIHRFIARHGGISPAPRTRAQRCLSLAEREEISRALGQNRSFGWIAEQLGRNKSSISREVSRNGGREAYRAHAAEERAWRCALRPKVCVMSSHAALRACVARRLSLRWSPAQIAGWLKRRYPARQETHISHETIYRTLYIQTKSVAKRQ